jgi:hypothetical protein
MTYYGRLLTQSQDTFMKMRQAAAPAKTISASEAAGMVRSGMWIDYYVTLSQPDLFDRALKESRGQVR